MQAARIGPGDIERFLRENNAKILQDAVDELLLVQRAQELGYKISAAYMRDVIDNIKKENKIESDDELQRQLRREGMTLDDLKRNIERSILKRQVVHARAATEGRGQRGGLARGVRGQEGHRVHAQGHRAPAGDRPQGRRQGSGRRSGASRARGRGLRRPGREALVGIHPQQRGRPGQVSQGDLAPEVEKVAFALPAGGVSDPLPTAEGWRILRVVERSETAVTPYEEIKADLQKRLSQARFAAHYDSYMEGLRKGALIDLRVREVPLTVTVPTGASILEAPSAQPGAPTPAPSAAPADPAAEFTVTPSTPTPSPTPTPPPQ